MSILILCKLNNARPADLQIHIPVWFNAECFYYGMYQFCALYNPSFRILAPKCTFDTYTPTHIWDKINGSSYHIPITSVAPEFQRQAYT